ncbi:TPA: HAMP domain-containing histidine kinase [Bacillus cereus]|nr:HAMP domain-containing histidine kinase [Bacillus cereus]HDR4742408.1 HAMP domain-containing histidine kinase [Bacillus cereus]HDR4747995.1 HAMP domain-containing histidine kinase [Bacillus cereus]HDR4753469.1 HAMP domain-containing histidine kinase [Bacillus cereus]HDR4770678.1 HAMP domain-containing histidine kinase [Bacillus cereus]
MRNKIRKFLKNFVKRDRLRVQVVAFTIGLILISAIPVNLFSMYNELQLTTQREYEAMFARAEKIQQKLELIQDGGGKQQIDDDFFKFLSYPGESIKVKIGQPGIGEYNYYSPSDKNDTLGLFGSQLLTLFVPTFFDSIRAHMNKLDSSAKQASYSFYSDEKNKAYGIVSYSFKHENHVDKITLKRDITTNLKMQIMTGLESLLYMFLWFLFFSVISALAGLKFIFRPLQDAIDTSFEGVVENNYQIKIEDPLYGEEISKIVNRFNAVLDRMNELVQNNLNSMQDVSHEVKTYLTAIKQSVDMIKFYGKENKELVDEKLLAIEDNIARVTSIMSTILELARLKQITNIDNANYYEVKHLINYLLRFKSESYPDFIFDTCYDAESVEIFVDRNHFFLMMNPIIDNAVKYSIDSTCVKINVISKTNDNTVSISVTNIGVPLDPKEIPFLFDRYYRGKNLEHTKQGSGLGLTIAKEVMNIYKGEIIAQGTPDGKTSFVLSFPKAVRIEDSGK